MKRATLAVFAALAVVLGALSAFGSLGGAAVAAATTDTVNLQVLVIGGGTTDPTTVAWEAALTQEGVAYTVVQATGTAPDETVTLPTLSSGTTGEFNGVVIADSPADFASGQLTALDTYEATFGVRQLDGYVYPSSTLGVTETSAGALDGTTGTLTAAGLAAFPGLSGSVPFDTGTYGYESSVTAGAPFTPWLLAADGTGVLAGVYKHPSSDPQANVQEAALFFDYNSGQSQWSVLDQGLVAWVTSGSYLGLYRNYVEMDIDDTFTPDDAWDTTTHSIDYNEADALRMQPADVVYAADWSAANDFRLDQLFNGGGSVDEQSDNGGTDPLLAQFQATDPSTGKPYTDDFGWISHTYDTPYLDVGCATQNYIEAEINENSAWAATAPGATPGTGGLGLTENTTDPSDALGYENPDVFVPGNHSGFADLEPGNPATVDPPDLDSDTPGTGGTLADGDYDYAVTDQFTDSSSAGQSSAAVVDDVPVPADGEVTLTWQSICHASDYLIYREVSGSGDWYLIGTIATPTSEAGTLPDNSSGDPVSTTDVTGGGELEQTFPDTGAAGTAEAAGWTPPTTQNAEESAWEQNPYFIPALEAVGITDVGDDASKPYPNPPTSEFAVGDYTGSEYAAGQTFLEGSAQVVPRHPNNIYYNASTEAQEVDEYNTIYLAVADGGTCVDSSTTTCLTTPATFADIVNQVVAGMFQDMTTNDPEPTYVHQTNLMGEPPAGGDSAPIPSTPDTTGDGLLYSVLNPLLAEYHTYFSAAEPYQQLTEAAIGTTLAEQAAWSAALQGGTVTATQQGSTVTITNNGSSSIAVPVTVPTGTTVGGTAFGQSYAGELSNWVTLAADSSETLTEPAVSQKCTSATLTATPTSVTEGTSVAMTSTATCPAGVTPSYVYWVEAPGSSSYVNETPWTGSSWTFSTTGLAAGVYHIMIWASGVPGSTPDTTATTTVTITVPGKCTSATLTASPTSLNVGTSVGLTAAAACPDGETPSFVYWVEAPGSSSYVNETPWTGATWTFSTTGLKAGTYNFLVWANAVPGSTPDTTATTSVVVAAAGKCSSASLTASPSSVTAGTAADLTAAAACPDGETPSFVYWVEAPGSSSYVNETPWTGATWTFSTTGLKAGTYNFLVWANAVPGSTPDTTATTSVVVAAAGKCSSASLTASPSSVTAGTAADLTATATCPEGVTPSYVYWVEAPGSSSYVNETPWTGSTWTFSTTGLAAGTYHILVWANAVPGSTADATATTSVVVTAAGKCTSATLTASPTSVNVGTSVGLTASATCPEGVTPSFVYWVEAPGSSSYVNETPWTGSTWTFSTTGLKVGTYNILVWANAVPGSTADTTATTSVAVAAAGKCSSATLTASPTSVNVGTSVGLTASATCPEGVTPSFVYWVEAPGSSSYVNETPWTGSTWTFSTTGLKVGTYNILVWANAVPGSTADTTATTSVAVAAAGKCSSATLTASPTSVTAGTSVGLTATAVCPEGVTPSFVYWVEAPGSSSYVNETPWTGDTWTFSTTGLKAGTYHILIWVNAVPGSAPDTTATTSVAVTAA